MAASLTRHAEQMYDVLTELVRRYQFRDRDQVCCHGLSVSQCYTLDLLADGQPRTMGDLAAQICLKISTATRVVDHLVAKNLARRVDAPHDRRVCHVQITQAGQALVARVRSEIVAEYQAVLKAVPAESRGAVIDALSHLLSAFKQRQCSVTDPPGGIQAAGGERTWRRNRRAGSPRYAKASRTAARSSDRAT